MNSLNYCKRALALCLLYSSFLLPCVVAQEVSFNRDVRPILSDKCYHCHGPDADNQKSDLRLDTREAALDAIAEGSLENSELHLRIHAEDEGEGSIMPPGDSNRSLSAAEKEILDQWILAGAPYEKHWSFEPVPSSITVPQSDSEWPNNDIDQFILKGIEAAGANPNQPASDEKWLRRVTFDLTGLPPTTQELDAFLADKKSNARENVVDRLLADVACAERLTTEWLDVARYSDTYGFQRDDTRFVWPYRDWVLRSFEKNMPYDQFVRWQLAGDLMEAPSRDQIVATVFNRLHSHKKEGGVAIEEFRVENVADRTHTFAGAFMGLTMECARCHDHKYDPTKTREYYQLSSFFANIEENGLISYFTRAVPTPAVPFPDEDQERQLDRQQRAIDHATQALTQAVANSNFEEWLTAKPSEEIPGLVAHMDFESMTPAQKPPKNKPLLDEDEKKKLKYEKVLRLANRVPGTEAAWSLDTNELVDGKFGKSVQLAGDDAVVLPKMGRFGRHQPFSVSLWIKAAETEKRGVIFRRSRGWDDAGSIGYELTKEGATLSAKLVHFWPGEAISVEIDDALVAGQWQHVVVTYDGSSSASGLKIYLDGVSRGMVVKDHLTRTITQWDKGYRDLAIGARYRDRGFVGGQVDEFKVFDRELAAGEAAQLFDGKTLSELLERAANDDLDDAGRAQLRSVFQMAHCGEIQKARKNLESARKSWNETMDSVPAISVMIENERPRDAFVLTRGAYDDHGEQITAGVPEFLSPWPADAPKNRLGLAQWVTAPDHPLLARVTVNRYWQMMFNQGLVRTPEDFGLQGEAPTHPELLDWLARDFISHGWNVRRLLRQMALSKTYAQSATVSRAVRAQDPENRLLARAPGNRLSAEMLRDSVLLASGLLNQKVGGAPVNPYDLALAYNKLEVDQGDKLYRRSLYTFWKRSSPAPVMMTMDANKRDVCRVKRESTASPLQALVLLNGTQFVEASRVMAEQLHRQFDGEIEKVIGEAYRRLTSRSASDRESDILMNLYREQLELFEADDDAAEKVLSVGSAPWDKNLSPAKLAAAAITVNVILNLDESVRQR